MSANLSNLIVRKIKRTDDVAAFDSIDENLNVFLKELSLQYMEEHLGVTFLAHLAGELVGYFTISMASLRVKQMKETDRIRTLDMESYPAVLIGRLAVDKRHAMQGIGKRLIQTAYGFSTRLRDQVGVRFLLVNATENSIEWWKQRGFTLLAKQSGRLQPFLYLDIKKMDGL